MKLEGALRLLSRTSNWCRCRQPATSVCCLRPWHGRAWCSLSSLGLRRSPWERGRQRTCWRADGAFLVSRQLEFVTRSCVRHWTSCYENKKHAERESERQHEEKHGQLQAGHVISDPWTGDGGPSSSGKPGVGHKVVSDEQPDKALWSIAHGPLLEGSMFRFLDNEDGYQDHTGRMA